MIEQAIDDAVASRLALADPLTHTPPEPALPLQQGVPTLAAGVHRDFSPMLEARFRKSGRWLHATHGAWLSLQDMQALWQDPPADPFLNAVKANAEAARDNWANHAWALFRDDRLSLFAGSDLGNESVFLLWLDFEDEPEVWAYDSNGESRYPNLEAYLAAYVAGDVSAAERSWRA